MSSSILQIHAVNANVDTADARAGVFADHIANLIDNGAAHGGDVHAVLHNNVQLNGNVPFFVGNDAHMPLTPKQLVAAAPVIFDRAASEMLISPFSVCSLIMEDTPFSLVDKM